MVLILSNEYDISTFKVIDWLLFKNKKFKIIHPSNLLSVDKIELLKGECFSIMNNQIGRVTSFWHRKGQLLVDSKQVKIPSFIVSKNNIASQIEHEIETLSMFINDYLMSTKKTLGNLDLTKRINKLIVLKYALKAGLMIPDTLITSNKEELLFKNRYKSIVTKPISESIILNEEDCSIYTYTTKVSNLSSIPNTFFPSLFQEYIDKKYELRIFYINKKFFTCAIFSQTNESTKVDFRNYNFNNPNRSVPYNLPKNIQRKINCLMKKLNLDTASIDMVVNRNNEYFFLEVNPVGQFGMITMPCNYNIYKTIANNII